MYRSSGDVGFWKKRYSHTVKKKEKDREFWDFGVDVGRGVVSFGILGLRSRAEVLSRRVVRQSDADGVFIAPGPLAFERNECERAFNLFRGFQCGERLPSGLKFRLAAMRKCLNGLQPAKGLFVFTGASGHTVIADQAETRFGASPACPSKCPDIRSLRTSLMRAS